MFKHFMSYELLQSYELKNQCSCGAVSDHNYIFTPTLLRGPVHSICQRHKYYDQISCFNEWDVAIPLGDCKERRDIERLIVLGKERDCLIDRLEEVENLIKGEKK